MKITLLFYILFALQSVINSDLLDENSHEPIAEQQQSVFSVNELLDLMEESLNQNAFKAIQYLQEILNHEDQLSDKDRLRLYKLAGILYFDQGSYDLALDFFFKHIELEKKISTTPGYDSYISIGNIYIQLNKLDKARKYYNLYLKEIKPDKNVDRYGVYNNIAIIERKEGNYLKAIELLNKYLSEVERRQDTVNIIKSLHNLANVHIDLNEYEKGLDYLNRSIDICKNTDSYRNLSYSFLNKGYFYDAFSVNRDSAFYYFNQAYELSNRYKYDFIKTKAAQMLTKVYESREDYKEANRYLHIYNELKEEFHNKENEKNIVRVELEYKFEKIKQDIINKQKQKEFWYISGTVLLFLISILALLLYKLQRSKVAKREIENKALEEQLESKNKELTNNVMHMLQVTELTNSTTKKIINIRNSSTGDIKKELTSLLNDIQYDNQGMNWDEFETLLIETNRNFYKNLLLDFPSLTQNEIRLCAFMKMNLTTKEISAITKQSINSINVARSRLRKKLNLVNEDMNMASFFAKY